MIQVRNVIAEILETAVSAKWLRFTVLFVLMGMVFPVYAQTIDATSISASTMIENLAKQLPSLMRLITALAYVMGMFFIFAAIFKLKQYGESRTMMSSQHDLKGPILYLIVGASLLYLPTSVQVGMSTFWTDPNPYGYIKQTDQWGTFFSNVFMLIQLFGVIAFIRGLVILSHLGGHGGQPGTFGRGMTHIIGGILCINIYQFVQVVIVTLFGIQLT